MATPIPERPVGLPAAMHRWADLPIDRPMARIERQRVIGSQMMISRVVLERGFAIATHHHPNEQFAVVLSGRMRFGIGAEGSPERRTLELVAGEVLHLPPNVPHSAEAIETSVLLDLFAPPSEKTGVDEATGSGAVPGTHPGPPSMPRPASPA
ncbi:MAG: cupin domain-containing protein [Phycisphaerales bacterium]